MVDELAEFSPPPHQKNLCVLIFLLKDANSDH